MAKVELYQGEAQLLPFRIKDQRTGQALNLTGATYLLWVKRPEDLEPVIVKSDSDFDDDAEASGYLTVFLTPEDTWQEPGLYSAELRIVTADTPAKTMKLPFDLKIMEAVTPSDFTLEPTGIVSLEAFGTPVIT